MAIPTPDTHPDLAQPATIALPPPADAAKAHLAWPKMARTPAGTILLACIAGRFHGSHGEGCPVVSVSRDGAQSFSEPHVLREFGPDRDYSCSGNMAIGVAPDGALVALAMAFTAGERNSIFGWRSENEGQTWSIADAAALADNKTGSTYGNIIALPDGRLTVFGHYRQGSSPHQKGIWQAFSHDQGRTWETARRITDRHLVEPAFIRTSSGRLVGIIRDSSVKMHSTCTGAVSDDEGQNWTFTDAAIRARDESRFRLPSPFLVEDPEQPGQLLAAVTERCVPGNTPGSISLWTASADTLEWKRGPDLVTFPHREGDPNTDFGYPWMLPLGQGKWLLVFYFGEKAGPNAIWKTVVTLP